MTMSTLMCPHCGGRLLIDPTQGLQSMLSCPYCGRKSLMQKINGMIVLRGIISQVSQASQSKPQNDEDSDQTTVDLSGQTRETAESHGVPIIHDDTPWQPLSETPVDPMVEMPAPLDCEIVTPGHGDTEETEIAEVASDAENDIEFSDSTSIESDDHLQNSLFEAGIPESIQNETEAATPAPEPEAATTETKPEAATPAPDTDTPDETAPFPDAEPIPEAATHTRKEWLIAQAIRAAATGEIPAFNSYSRQAIDCDPTDPRMYAARARLVEEAHGFARATYLSPIWADQTPRQKAWVIAQHFISLNAAVAYSTDEAQLALASEAGSLIAWQIRETFVENAQLRLGKKPFSGRFHRRDLRNAPQVIDACMRINETVVPHISSHLLRAIRLELEKLDPRLAEQIQRIGF